MGSMKKALLGSLALHLLLLGWVWRQPAHRAHPEEGRSAALEVEVQWVESPPPPPVLPRPPRPQRERTNQVSPEPPSIAEVESAAPTQASPSSSPPPQPPARLLPRPDLLGGAMQPGVAPSPGGRTLRPGDPSLSPEVAAEEEAHRVGSRVNGWMSETLAQARVEGGLPPPYLTGVGSSMREGLDQAAREENLGPSLFEALGSRAERYLGAMGNYGRTGDPQLGPPGLNPRLSEQLQQRFGNEPATGWMRGLAGAAEMAEDLRAAPLLTLTLELRLPRNEPPQVELLQGSGDARFDEFVLQVVPGALTDLQLPPSASADAVPRSHWEVTGWLAEGSAHQVWSMFGFYGVTPGDLLNSEARYEFRTRLLRAY